MTAWPRLLDRKKLGHALQHGHDNRLQCSQGGPRRSIEMTPGGRFIKIPWQSARRQQVAWPHLCTASTLSFSWS